MEFAKDLKRNFNKFKHNRFNPSVNEWANSIYCFEPGWYNKNSQLINNKLSYNLINTYFNIKFFMKKKVLFRKKLVNRLSNLSLNRIFVSYPEFKHCLQNMNILIYIFNKEEILLLKKLKKLKSLHKYGSSNFKHISKVPNEIFINKTQQTILNLKNNNEFVFNTKYVVIKKDIRVQHFKILLYKSYLARLYFNKFKFNLSSLFYLKKILCSIYKTEVNINIINLKYLHLDNSIFVDAITRKLKDRKKKVLRVLRRALILPKIPKIDHLLLINKKIAINFFSAVKQQYKYLTFNDFLDANTIKKSIYHNMKNTHIVGIRLEGKGRLTRRLTASRAVFKIAYLGSLKNIVSSFQGLPCVINKGFEKSNINYVHMYSNNRNGAFGIKSWQNTM